MWRSAGVAVLSVFLGAVPAWASGIRAEHPWARATAGLAANGAAYVTLINGDGADRLVSASSPAAKVVELHTHLEEDGVMRMRPVPVIDMPAGGTVTLQPGGLHIMLIDLKSPLKEGRTVPLTLVFEHAGVLEVQVPILSAAARGP